MEGLIPITKELSQNSFVMKKDNQGAETNQPSIIKVEYCTNCPFSSWSWSGGVGMRRRTQHKCNLQNTEIQYNQLAIYSCFDTCPLKESTKSVHFIQP